MAKTTNEAAARPHEPSSTANATITTGSAIVLAFAVVSLLGLALFHALFVAFASELFSNFDVELPLLTTAVLSISPVLAVAGYLLCCAVLVMKEFVPFLSSSIKGAINFVTLLLCLLGYMLYIIALFLPMTSLMESLM